MITVFRLTVEQQRLLAAHLFKGDGMESVVVGVCGMRRSEQQIVFTLHEIFYVPDESCSIRSPVTVRWPVETALPFFDKAIRRRMAFFKIHSHPTYYDDFSKRDDESDAVLFESLQNMADDTVEYVSAFMLPNQMLRVRHYSSNGSIKNADRITVVGDNVQFVFMNTAPEHTLQQDEASLRTRQAFGEGTTNILRNLRVGIVGCSGTGSWVTEMVARLGVGTLVLVDPDVVERKNLNRIVNSTADDATKKTHKTTVLKRAIESFGFGTKVICFESDLDNAAAILALAECDFLFGCVDSADGRDSLNRIATYYIIPFIDIGVRLDADGNGGIQQIAAAVHYLIPGGSSLLKRGVITAKQVADQALRRTQPEQFESLKAEGYVHGAPVDSPAVISVNGFVAAHAVNEMLARIHPFRSDENIEFRHQVFSLVDGTWNRVPDDRGPCDYLSQKVGRGDCRPLIDNPSVQ